MTNLSAEYIRFLSELQGAPLSEMLRQHSAFWSLKSNEANNEFDQAGLHAYHLGTIPTESIKNLASEWFFKPEFKLQRIGLYADVIVFDDIVGEILAKSESIPKKYQQMIPEQVRKGITLLQQLSTWAEAGIIKILPCDKVLRKFMDIQRLAIPFEEKTSWHDFLVKIHQLLATRYDEEELRTLCFYLEVDYDNLLGEGKANKARELIKFLDRRNLILQLVKIGKRQRPDISWGLPELPEHRQKIYRDRIFASLDRASAEQSSGELPYTIIEKLSTEQREALSIGAGHVLNHKINKALLLKDQFDLVPCPDDTFFEVLGEKLKWDHRVLGDTGNLYILKKIRPKYLCDSPELVFELRKQDQLWRVRKFFRENFARAVVGNGVQSLLSQAVIDELSRDLADSIREADSELDILRRKLSTKASDDLIASGELVLSPAIDQGHSFASWIPSLISSLSPAQVNSSILETIKDHIASNTEIQARFTPILGCQKESL